MEKLAASLPQVSALSSESDNSTDQHQTSVQEYAAERASFLFKQYRTGEANDPEIYTASIAAILSDYPTETIRYVTDPRTGIASNPRPDQKTGRVWTGMPNPADVKIACEDHHGPVRRAMERARADEEYRREAARNRAMIEDRSQRPTYAELQARCAQRGVFIGNAKAPGAAVDATAFREKHGVTKEQWDAIPDASGGR